MSVDVMHPIERQIAELFVQAGAEACAEQAETYRLLDDPAMDSFQKISVYMELESFFAIRLSPEELLDERYRSVSGLALLVAEKAPQSLNARR